MTNSLQKTNTGDKRLYNVFFNTHTVSGIVISIGLFVCFFAGAFALFVEEINHWEANEKRTELYKNVDYERVLEVVTQEGYVLQGRNLSLRHRLRDRFESVVQVRSAALPTDSTQLGATAANPKAREAIFMEINPRDYQIVATSFEDYEHLLGDYLYELHYFGQIPIVGIYLSGLVALFFGFAILTGIIIHWNKIVSNFFTFRLKASIKNLWTDAHTALGVIGLPFQLMYAITGAFYGLSAIILALTLFILFDGNQDKLVGEILPVNKVYENTHQPMASPFKISDLVNETIAETGRDDLFYTGAEISAYGDQNAHITVYMLADSKKEFYGDAYITYSLANGKVVARKGFGENTYSNSVLTSISKLHFADFGGYFMKAVYFGLAIVTCFVILSGVLIWITARQKKMYAHRQKFNTNVAAITLGACMGLYPAIALFFCMTKLFPAEMPARFDTMAYLFFGFWFAYIVYAYFHKNLFHINRNALFLAGTVGIMIPVFNGLHSGLWLWKSFSEGYTDSFFIDVAWLVMGMVTLLAARIAKPTHKEDSATSIKSPGVTLTEKAI